MQAAAQDFDTAIMAQTIQDAADQISESLRTISPLLFWLGFEENDTDEF